MPGAYLQPTLATLARRPVYLRKLGVKESGRLFKTPSLSYGDWTWDHPSGHNADGRLYQHLTRDEILIHPQRHPHRAPVHIQYQTPGMLRNTQQCPFCHRVLHSEKEEVSWECRSDFRSLNDQLTSLRYVYAFRYEYTATSLL